MNGSTVTSSKKSLNDDVDNVAHDAHDLGFCSRSILLGGNGKK